MKDGTVKIEFPDVETAQVFMSWMCGGGEQDYWIWEDEQGKYVKKEGNTQFEYDFEEMSIVAKR